MAMIDVTPILKARVKRMSASQSELGVEAGRITWATCMRFARRHPIITDENRDDVRDHFKAYGAWSRSEINGWTDTQLAAMVWQEAAADMRHFREECKGSLAKYQADCEAGRISGRLWVDGETAHFYAGM